MRSLLVAIGATLLIGVPAAAQEVEPWTFGTEQTVYMPNDGSQWMQCNVVEPDTGELQVVNCPPPGEVSIAIAPALTPSDLGVAPDVWVRHVDDSLERYFKIIEQAKSNNVKQVRRQIDARVRWAKAETKWLASSEAQACYSDEWDAWSEATSKLLKSAQLEKEGVQVRSERLLKSGIKQGNKAFGQLLETAKDVRGSCPA